MELLYKYKYFCEMITFRFHRETELTSEKSQYSHLIQIFVLLNQFGHFPVCFINYEIGTLTVQQNVCKTDFSNKLIVSPLEEQDFSDPQERENVHIAKNINIYYFRYR